MYKSCTCSQIILSTFVCWDIVDLFDQVNDRRHRLLDETCPRRHVVTVDPIVGDKNVRKTVDELMSHEAQRRSDTEPLTSHCWKGISGSIDTSVNIHNQYNFFTYLEQVYLTTLVSIVTLLRNLQ